MRPLRLGILLGCAAPPPHLSRLLDVLAQARPLELSLLMLKAANRPGLCDTLARLILRSECGILGAVSRLSPGIARRLGALDSCQTRLRSRFAQVIECWDDKSSDANKAALGNTPALDLLLVFGCDPLHAGELPARATEVIQVHLGSGLSSSLHQAGFAEAFAEADETPLSLHLLGDAGATRPLISGSTRTRQLFLLNQSALWDRAASVLLTRLLEPVGKVGAVGESTAEESAATGKQQIRAVPDGGVSGGGIRQIGRMLLYPLRLSCRFVYLAIRQLRGKRRWSVAIHKREADLEAGTTLPIDSAPAGTYWADPFLYRCPSSGTRVCFVEEYDQALGRGHIAVLEQGPGGWRRRGTVLKEPHHLSFPFVFDYQGLLYMCPEGDASGTITLYRCSDFPMQWVPCATLMRGVSAADTMLFPRNGRWWMLTNIDRALQPDHQSELHLFHADSPLSEEWTPVPGNPVKLTSNGARNGGLLVDGERIFRFGQRQGFHAYSQGLDLYEITGLDETGYSEVLRRRVLPPAGSSAIGIHTWSSLDDVIGVDLLGASFPSPSPSPSPPTSPQKA